MGSKRNVKAKAKTSTATVTVKRSRNRNSAWYKEWAAKKAESYSAIGDELDRQMYAHFADM